MPPNALLVISAAGSKGDGNDQSEEAMYTSYFLDADGRKLNGATRGEDWAAETLGIEFSGHFLVAACRF